jgi:hypothetical protein
MKLLLLWLIGTPLLITTMAIARTLPVDRSSTVSSKSSIPQPASQTRRSESLDAILLAPARRATTVVGAR